MPSTVKVFDPALCCSTGVCGPTSDSSLPRIAADLEWLRGQGVAVARFNLAQEPGAFVAEAVVRRALEEGGVERLPLVLVDGRVLSQGRYPDRATLAAALSLGVPVGAVDAAPACCEPNDPSCCAPIPRDQKPRVSKGGCC